MDIHATRRPLEGPWRRFSQSGYRAIKKIFKRLLRVFPLFGAFSIHRSRCITLVVHSAVNNVINRLMTACCGLLTTCGLLVECEQSCIGVQL